MLMSFILCGIQSTTITTSWIPMTNPWYQSFTSLIADLFQDFRVSSFSKSLNGSFPLRNCSIKDIGTMTQMRRVLTSTTLLFCIG